MAQQRQLLVMACSATKRQDDGKIPALERYDGSTYRVLRNFLRQSAWPRSLSVAVLSARYGLIGGLAQIEGYDVRMTRALADSRKSGTTEILRNWAIRDSLPSNTPKNRFSRPSESSGVASAR